MAIVYQASDSVERAHDTDFEQFGNIHLYGVISGCAVSYDAANMTLDVAAGVVLFNGAPLAVAAQTNALTLVADGSSPRWSIITINSGGTAVLTSGTAAASPSKPEAPDGVILAMVLIEAAQTIANNIVVKLDKRTWTHSSTEVERYTTATQVLTTTTTFADVIGNGVPATFTFTMAANEVWRGRYRIRSVYAGTGGLKLQFTGPAAPTAVRVNGTWNGLTSEGSGDAASAFPQPFTEVTAFSSAFAAFNASASTSDTYITTDNYGAIDIFLFVQNGANAGDVTLQVAQNSSNTTSTLQIGCWMEAKRVS